LKRNLAQDFRRGVELAKHADEELDAPSFGCPLCSADVPDKSVIKVKKIHIFHK